MSDIPGDTYDPCATYIELRDAYLQAASGKGVKRVRFRNGEDERETEFTGANLDQLERAMNRAKDECLRLQGKPSSRSAIGVGRRGPGLMRVY